MLQEILLVVLALILFVLGHYKVKYGVWKKLGVTGPTPWPFIGNLPDMLRCASLHELDMEYSKKYGQRGYFGQYSGSTPTLVITDPEIIKDVMIKQFDKFVNRPRSGALELKYFREDVSNTRGEKWKRMRNRLTPGFTGARLKAMVNMINFVGENLSKKFEHVIAEEEGIFEPKKVFQCATLDIICNIALSTHVDSQENPDHFLPQACWKLMANNEQLFKKPLTLLAFAVPSFGAIYRRFDPNIGLDFSPLDTIATAMEEIHKKFKAEGGKSGKKDFLHMMIEEYERCGGASEENKELTWEAVIAQPLIFLLAGFETTSDLMTWTCYHLCVDQALQQKVVEEMQGVVQEGNDTITYEQLNELPVLENVLLEALRFYPVFRTMRECGQDTVIGPDKIPVKKGFRVEVATYPLHMDPKVWEDPEVFNPDRFTGPDAHEKKNYSYNAFGIGNRNCIGMRLALFETKMALTKVLMRYKLELAEGTPTKITKFIKNQFRQLGEPLKLKISPRV